MISKGCVRTVATIPDSTPAGSLCQPMALHSQQNMQCSPPKAPSLIQLDSPPLKNPPKPSLRSMSPAAAPTDAYPWKYASSKRVQMMFKGLVNNVLARRDNEDARKLCLAVISSRSNALSPQKQMQHPRPAFNVAAARPLQKPLSPSAQQMQRQDERNEAAGELPAWTAASSLGGSMRAILMFSNGCRRTVDSTPLSIPKSPFSLIIPDQLCTPAIISPTLSEKLFRGRQHPPLERYCSGGEQGGATNLSLVL